MVHHEMLKMLISFLIIIIGILLGVLATVFDFNFISNYTPSAIHVEFGFAELASIGLTAATVALGSVALVVGVAAVFGFQSIRAESVKNAEREVNRVLNDSLDAKVDAAIIERLDPRIRAIIESAGSGGALDQAVARIMYGARADELQREFDPQDDGER